MLSNDLPLLRHRTQEATTFITRDLLTKVREELDFSFDGNRIIKGEHIKHMYENWVSLLSV